MLGEARDNERPGPPPLISGESEAAARSAPSSGRRRRRSRKATSVMRRLGSSGGVILLAAVVGVTPLVVGGVHRCVAIAVFALVAIAMTALVVADAAASVPLRLSAAAAAPLLAFFALPLLQSVPLPMGLANRLDPTAADLLVGGQATGWRPLSLDPPATWLAFGQAAVALATVLVTAHAMSGRSLRYLLLRAVALSGVAAVIIGVGHRILGEENIYGAFHASRGILNGPFINPNHTAEFLEL